jgi:hypothetical protein
MQIKHNKIINTKGKKKHAKSKQKKKKNTNAPKQNQK